MFNSVLRANALVICLLTLSKLYLQDVIQVRFYLRTISHLVARQKYWIECNLCKLASLLFTNVLVIQLIHIFSAGKKIFLHTHKVLNTVIHCFDNFSLAPFL